MKKKMLAIVMLLSFCLSGCTATQTGVDQLISPPKLSEQQSKIYTALEANSGKNIKLKYPKKGEYTSAFLVSNLDNEDTDEAVVFYETQGVATTSTSLRIVVLDQRESKWVCTFETSVQANEVEKVTFARIKDKINIIIGFNQTGQGEKIVKQYIYENEKLRQISSTKCNNYEVFDIDDDGVKELITITTKSPTVDQKISTASVYNITNSGVFTIDSTSMDPAVSEYVNVNGGRLLSGRPALYLDGVKNISSLSTEILLYSDNSLTNTVYNQDESKNIVDTTLRGAGAFSLDFDEKGVFYIPISTPAPGYGNDSQSQTYTFTDWYTYTGRQMKHMQTAYVDYKLGFIFTLPKIWAGVVTVEKSVADNEIVFYEYTGDIKDNKTKLLSIKTIKKSDYATNQTTNTHRILKDNGQLMYLYYLYDSDSILSISEADVRECFNLLHGGSSNEKNPGM